MNKDLKPLLIVGGFWLALFFFVAAGYSGNLGFTAVTGNAVNEDGSVTPLGIQTIAILILFFTNLVTLFFLVRAIAKK
jgi:hypothetical protein